MEEAAIAQHWSNSMAMTTQQSLKIVHNVGNMLCSVWNEMCVYVCLVSRAVSRSYIPFKLICHLFHGLLARTVE